MIIETINLLLFSFEILISKSPEKEVNNYKTIFKNFTVAYNLDNVATPYVFFIDQPYDFQWKEAYFHRMILEAEKQNADIGTIFFATKIKNWKKIKFFDFQDIFRKNVDYKKSEPYF